MTGEAEESFDLWEVDRFNTDPAKSYEELMTKGKNCSRRRKFDSSAKEKMQCGGDAVDVGAAGRWSWNDDTGNGCDQGDGVYALASKARVKAKAAEREFFF